MNVNGTCRFKTSINIIKSTPASISSQPPLKLHPILLKFPPKSHAGKMSVFLKDKPCPSYYKYDSVIRNQKGQADEYIYNLMEA